MSIKFPTFEESRLFIRDVHSRLIADNDDKTFQLFEQTLTDFMEGIIQPEYVVSDVQLLFKDQPHVLQDFQKFFPLHLQQNHIQNKIQQNCVPVVEKEADTVKESMPIVEFEEKNQEIAVQESDVVEEKGSIVDNINEALSYVNRVLKGFEAAGEPDLIPKFFEAMADYRSDKDREKLNQRLTALFKDSYPEYEIELKVYDNSLKRITCECPSTNDDVKNALEAILDKYEEVMYTNDMSIGWIQSAIENTVKFVRACQSSKSTEDVTMYLNAKNVKEIAKHCKVNLKNCENPEQTACVVIGKLKVQLEVAKEKGRQIVRNKSAAIQKFQNNKRRRTMN